MKPSQACLDLIKTFEGLRLFPYRDIAGHWTVGFGHKMAPGDNPLQSITRDKAIALLGTDADETAALVWGLVGDIVPAITQGMFDAITSFSYNLGAHSLAKSTLLVKLRSGDIEGAADQFGRWDCSNGRPVPGLATRRAAERLIFLGDALEGA